MNAYLICILIYFKCYKCILYIYAKKATNLLNKVKSYEIHNYKNATQILQGLEC